MVLTGDKLIRKWCTKNKLKVHGILWLLDEFVEPQLLTHSEANQKLNDLLEINQWLPAKACEQLIEKWNDLPK